MRRVLKMEVCVGGRDDFVRMHIGVFCGMKS